MKERIKVVNKILEEIGERGRKFFSSHCDNHIMTKNIQYSYFWFDKELLFMDVEQGRSFQAKAIKKENILSHGGTLYALLNDFIEFIETGRYTNHSHGYGGLYCPHWGYDDFSMQEIRRVARELGYLAPTDKEDMEFGRKLYMEGEQVERYWIKTGA